MREIQGLGTRQGEIPLALGKSRLKAVWKDPCSFELPSLQPSRVQI